MSIKHIAHPLFIKNIQEDGSFCGYASVFGTKDSQNEIVASGAFMRTLKSWTQRSDSPAMLWMHDPTKPIGLWISLQEDENGLVAYGKLALGTQKGKEAYELLKMGALTGLSIGYRVLRSQIDRKRKARVLTDVELFEISLVTFPANDKARVISVKSPKKTTTRKASGKKKTDKKKTISKTDADATRAIVARLKKAARTLQQNSLGEPND